MRYVLAVVVLISGVAVGQELPQETYTIKALTVEQAQVLLKREVRDGLFDLSGLTTLSPQVARVLAQHKWSRPGVPCMLALNGLTTLSPETAQELAQCNKSLMLHGLTELTPDAAKALAPHKGNLMLKGLTELTPEVARALAEHESVLTLDGLTDLSPEVARALAKHAWGLNLNGLTKLTDEAAQALAQYEGVGLTMSRLATISPGGAAALRANRAIQLPAKFQ